MRWKRSRHPASPSGTDPRPPAANNVSGSSQITSSADAKRWGRAFGEVFDEAKATGGRGGAAVHRAGEETLDRVTETVRSVEIDAAPCLARTAAEGARTAVARVAGRLTVALDSPFRRHSGPAQPGRGDKAAPGAGDEEGSPDDED